MTRLASILLVATVFSPAAWAGALGSRDHSQVVARGDQSTITDPNFRCPEAIGKDMMKCSDDLCGGENPKKKGYCRRGVLIQRPEQKPLQPHYCHCDPKEGDGDGGGVPIIPFPPPPIGFAAPPAGVPHPKKKDTCPKDYADTKCNNCKAKSGWCTEGDHAGCPCREECPADDDKDAPQCSEKDCKGEDGKCTVGHYKDCKCKNKCPDMKKSIVLCDSDNCKGEEDKKKPECKTGKYQGCQCAVKIKPPILHAVSVQTYTDNMKYISTVNEKYKEWKKNKPNEKPKCVATSNTGIIGDDFTKARDAFCKDPSKKYDKGYFELSLDKSDGDCPKDDCKDTLNSIWNTCAEYHSRPEPSSDDKLDDHHGPLRGTATASGKCGKYTAKKSDAKPKFKPPGEDAPGVDGKPIEVVCHQEAGAIGVKKDEMEAAIDEFCKDGKSLDPRKDSSAGSLLKKMGDGTLILHGSPNMGSNPEPVDMYKDRNACHEFDQNIRSDDCKKALKKIYEKCDSDGGDKKLYGGSWIYNCVHWSSRTTGFK